MPRKPSIKQLEAEKKGVLVANSTIREINKEEKQIKEHAIQKARKSDRKRSHQKNYRTQTVTRSGGSVVVSGQSGDYQGNIRKMAQNAGGSPQVRSLLTAYCLPGVTTTPRLHGRWGSQPSTTAAPFYRFAISSPVLSELAPAYEDPPQGFVAISRNPLMAMMWTSFNTPSFLYSAQFESGSDGIASTVGPWQYASSRGPSDVDLVPIAWTQDVLFTGTNAMLDRRSDPYGEICYTHYALGRKWTFVGSLATSWFTFNIQLQNGDPYYPVGTIIKTYRLIDDQSEVEISAVALTDASSRVYVQQNVGFYRHVLCVGTGTAVTNYRVGATYNCFGDLSKFCICTRPLPRFTPSQFGSEIKSLRVNTMSLLISNIGIELEKNGLIAGRQFAPAENFLPFLNADAPFDYLNSLNDSTQKNLSTGMYGFARPSNPSVYDYVSPFSTAEDGVDIAAYKSPVYPPGGWLVIAYAHDPGHSLSLEATPVWGVEYIADSVWLQRGSQRYDSQVYAAVDNVLYEIPQFHCNPLHLKDIRDGIMSVARGAAANAPLLLSLFSKMFPGVAIPSYAGSLALASARAFRGH